jgi:hypothetical protein
VHGISYVQGIFLTMLLRHLLIRTQVAWLRFSSHRDRSHFLCVFVTQCVAPVDLPRAPVPSVILYVLNALLRASLLILWPRTPAHPGQSQIRAQVAASRSQVAPTSNSTRGPHQQQQGRPKC